MKKIVFITIIVSLLLTIACNTLKQNTKQLEFVEGFGILSRLPGTWNGSVISTTSAGNFPEWYVDFRPVSSSQISQFSNLDSQTVNNLSFFIVRHQDKLKVAMRTEGCFNKSCCITYEVIDSVNEESGYYRFCDFIGGMHRASTVFSFRGDSMIMEVYTTKFNKEKNLVLHSRWLAVKGDINSANTALQHFKFPQPIMVRDFTNAFEGKSESIYFTFNDDPYPSIEQPYTGSVQLNIKTKLSIPAKSELFVVLSTQPIYNGLLLKPEFHNFYSRYLFVPAGTQSITLHNVHCGTYYLYAFADINQDKKHLSGDMMSSATENKVTISENNLSNAEVLIDMNIP